MYLSYLSIVLCTVCMRSGSHVRQLYKIDVSHCQSVVITVYASSSVKGEFIFYPMILVMALHSWALAIGVHVEKHYSIINKEVPVANWCMLPHSAKSILEPLSQQGWGTTCNIIVKPP